MNVTTVQQPSVTVATFFEYTAEPLGLELCAGAHGMGRELARLASRSRGSPSPATPASCIETGYRSWARPS